MSSIGTTQKEFHTFFKHVKYLRHLQKETLEAIEHVGKSGNLSQDQLDDLRFNSEETEDLRRALHVPTCILISGQSFYGKLALVSRLLGEQVLPIVNIGKKTDTYSYRPLRFQYTVNNTSYALHNSILRDDSEVPSKVFESLSLNDVEVPEESCDDSGQEEGIIQIMMDHGLLKESLQLILTPTFSKKVSKSYAIKKTSAFLQTIFSSVFPIVLYALTKITLTDQEVAELREIKDSQPKASVLFVRIPPLPESFGGDLPESEQHNILCKLGILPMPPPPEVKKSRHRHRRGSSPQSPSDEASSEDDDKSRKNVKCHHMPERLLYVLCDKIGVLHRQVPPQKLHERIIDSELRKYNDYLDDLHFFDKVNNFFNLVLNDLLVKSATLLHEGHSRCLRMFILYAFDMAREMQITPRRINYVKQKENELFENLSDIASKKQDEIKNIVLESLSEMRESLLEKATNYEFKDVELPESMEDLTPRDVRICTNEIQELVLSAVNETVGRQLALRLDIMRESYFGTLQRCLESLEKDCRESDENTNIGNILKQMMNAAYFLEVTPTTSSSTLRNFLEKMKQFVTARTPPAIDAEWKARVATEMMSSLSESKLARNICAQFKERLKLSHESFVVCMKQLESQLTNRLEQKEESHLRMKKCDAPKLARMSLESTSLRDMILYGMPTLEREVGRGQYGVVFGCKKWGNHKPCAIKSLVPLDDKHWNDLAMEFHYTRSIPENERIVALRGSVIDYTYGQGETPAVLLVMDRLTKDLYSGLKTGLKWLERLQIALDVTQGIRYLHSQGLVHRDIKLKNVLLDPENRAKLTDLGFCKPEAMMSGSIVGTPIHMAPELFTGHYDNSVDVYAFGILFWYICSGHVKLPLVFEQCHSKDQLWHCVRKGARPERLPCFTDRCWTLMNECWAGEPGDRPFLGSVEPRIRKIMIISIKAIEAAKAKVEEIVEESPMNRRTSLCEEKKSTPTRKTSLCEGRGVTPTRKTSLSEVVSPFKNNYIEREATPPRMVYPEVREFSPRSSMSEVQDGSPLTKMEEIKSSIIVTTQGDVIVVEEAQDQGQFYNKEGIEMGEDPSDENIECGEDALSRCDELSL